MIFLPRQNREHQRCERCQPRATPWVRAEKIKSPEGAGQRADAALHFLIAIKETLGDAWLHHSRYRFGASSLLNDLLRQIEKERTGAYQAPYVFSDATEGY